MACWAWDSQRRQYWKQRKPTVWSPYWGPDRFVSFQCKWIPTSWSEKVHWELEQRWRDSSYTVNIFSPVSITISLYGCNICLHYYGDFLAAYRRHSLIKKVQFLTPLLEISFIFLQRRVSGNINFAVYVISCLLSTIYLWSYSITFQNFLTQISQYSLGLPLYVHTF